MLDLNILPTPVEYILYGCLFLGVAKATILVLSFGSLLFDLLLLPKASYKKYGSANNCWALVTGSSDGLGAEYARQLAAKGFNIVLASRTLSKLETIAEEIESKYKVSTKVVAVDVTKVDEAVTQIAAGIEGLDVSVLINNVGQSHSIPVPFAETELSEITNIININNVFTLRITQLLIPILAGTASKYKAHSLILTMGSFGGLLPTPYLATYSGSKAFLQNWSASLAAELKADKIDVEFVLSYLVTSAMSKIRRTSWMIPNPKSFVASALNSVGKRVGAQERFATTTPFWSHALMHFGIDQTVGVYSTIANSLNFDMHKSIRVRALKKAERARKEQ
ncbi:17-beta-hydroxysteroid dehydrogenase [Yamadazyma tenuis]|uniref:Very-long-chain 3-oxoacyl-CoA reductase n=1 Tax=Candida tenuis (strain ATCC 10573 / BCRC 21748 / CBS 615 / JCM 9827 / NBRC 10315 / NRRL Y-1498 / VKM Y-70) TaxID=590646 RepID=G3AWP2_CANTC|nr:NAD(P)-binding protein [Yamadazyma tenuis ATCC 10573]EGV66584.1 NAD(P)-binding protein [Yamadazyma tenuis ATCC 10573]WEJ95292.1 17-beta-hydroxysteroid dehydrogenase [Yamadazyma tenuis]